MGWLDSERASRISGWVLVPLIGVLFVWWNIANDPSNQDVENEAIPKGGNNPALASELGQAQESLNQSGDQPGAGIFEEEYYGYKVLCGMLNTARYGYAETVDYDSPIFDSASAIFRAMGEDANQATKVMVIKGPEVTFRDTQNGVEYVADANGTMYCLTPQE